MDTASRQNPAAVYRVVDHYVDTEGDVPEFLKNASSPEVAELAGLSDAAFADGPRRHYPINSVSNAALSAIEYHAYGEEDKKTTARIKRACCNYGIEDFWETVENVFLTESTKSASTGTTKYAFVLTGEDNISRGYYPVNTAFEVEQSASSFLQSLDLVPIDIAAGIASEIVKSANELGVSPHAIPDVIQILGEPRVLDESWADTQVRLRKTFVPDYIGEAYEDIVKSASEGGDISELLALMDNLDQEFVPQEVIDTNILYRNAFCTLNSGVTVKNADDQALNYVFLSDEDVLLPVSAVGGISDDKIDAIFAKSTAEQVKEVVKSASTDSFTATALLNGLPSDIRKEFIKLTLQADGN